MVDVHLATVVPIGTDVGAEGARLVAALQALDAEVIAHGATAETDRRFLELFDECEMLEAQMARRAFVGRGGG